MRGPVGVHTGKTVRFQNPAGDKDEAGVYTNTEDIDCELCKGDLHLWAVVSPASPGKATCPEHVSALESPDETLRLLYRCLPIPVCHSKLLDSAPAPTLVGHEGNVG